MMAEAQLRELVQGDVRPIGARRGAMLTVLDEFGLNSNGLLKDKSKRQDPEFRAKTATGALERVKQVRIRSLL